MPDLGELVTIEDVTTAIMMLVANPPTDTEQLRRDARALAEAAQRVPRAYPGQERRAYRHELRQMRMAAGLPIERVARELEWSLSKAFRIEQGRVGISASDMRMLTRLYGADEATVERLVEESRVARQRPRR